MDGHFIRGCLHGGTKILELRWVTESPHKLCNCFYVKCCVLLFLPLETMNYIGFEVFHNRSAQRQGYAQVNVQCKTKSQQFVTFSCQNDKAQHRYRLVIPASDAMGMSMLVFILPGPKDNHSVSKTLAQSSDEQSRRIIEYSIVFSLLNR